MAIRLTELDPDLPVDVHEQGRLQNVTVAQVIAVLGFANNRFDGEKVCFDWGFTAQIDDAEPAICAVYDWNRSAGEHRNNADNEVDTASDGEVPPAEPSFYTFGPDVVFQTLFGSAYGPTPELNVAADAASNRKMPADADHFCFGVWSLRPRAEVVAQVKADQTVMALSEHAVRMLLAAAQRDFGARDGYHSLAPDAYLRVERAAAIGITKGLTYHPDPVPPLSEEDRYWLLHYQCDQCAYQWSDYWTSPADGECPRCGMRPLRVRPDSREIAASELPEWVNIRPHC